MLNTKILIADKHIDWC